jgi:hypothetical protein
LDFERQRHQYESSRDNLTGYIRELAAPLSTASEIATRLEQIVQQSPVEVRETGIVYLRELHRALTQMEQALHRLEQG